VPIGIEGYWKISKGVLLGPKKKSMNFADNNYYLMKFN